MSKLMTAGYSCRGLQVCAIAHIAGSVESTPFQGQLFVHDEDFEMLKSHPSKPPYSVRSLMTTALLVTMNLTGFKGWIAARKREAKAARY